jgi:hypothetical protein
MVKLKAIHAPYTIEHALESAREGRPEMLLMMIRDAMGADGPAVAAALAELMFEHPEKLRVRRQAAYLPHEAGVIRDQFAALVRAQPKKKPAVIHEQFARNLGILPDTLRDILEWKKTYAPKDGEQVPKRSPRKRMK